MPLHPSFHRALTDFKNSSHYEPIMDFLRHQSYVGRSVFTEAAFDSHRAAALDGRQQLYMALEDQLRAAEQTDADDIVNPSTAVS